MYKKCYTKVLLLPIISYLLLNWLLIAAFVKCIVIENKNKFCEAVTDFAPVAHDLFTCTVNGTPL